MGAIPIRYTANANALVYITIENPMGAATLTLCVNGPSLLRKIYIKIKNKSVSGVLIL